MVKFRSIKILHKYALQLIRMGMIERRQMQCIGQDAIISNITFNRASKIFRLMSIFVDVNGTWMRVLHDDLDALKLAYTDEPVKDTEVHELVVDNSHQENNIEEVKATDTILEENTLDDELDKDSLINDSSKTDDSVVRFKHKKRH